MQWDDLKVALALGKHGTVSGAARDLNVTNSTVNRRLAVLEDALGVRLFDRLRAGVRPTDAGVRLLEHADQMRRQAAELELSVLGGDQRLVGPLTLTCPPLLLSLVADGLATFIKQNDHIELIVRTDDKHADIAQREADVALRITANPPETLIGRRICRAAFGVYGHQDYVRSLHNTPYLIGEDDGLVQPSWWSADGVVRTRGNHLDWTLAAVRRAVGLARLPCFVGDREADLVRVGPLVDGPSMGVWVLSHQRLRTVARVRALTEALTTVLVAQTALLEGKA